MNCTCSPIVSSPPSHTLMQWYNFIYLRSGTECADQSLCLWCYCPGMCHQSAVCTPWKIPDIFYKLLYLVENVCSKKQIQPTWYLLLRHNRKKNMIRPVTFFFHIYVLVARTTILQSNKSEGPLTISNEWAVSALQNIQKPIHHLQNKAMHIAYGFLQMYLRVSFCMWVQFILYFNALQSPFTVQSVCAVNILLDKKCTWLCLHWVNTYCYNVLIWMGLYSKATLTLYNCCHVFTVARKIQENCQGKRANFRLLNFLTIFSITSGFIIFFARCSIDRASQKWKGTSVGDAPCIQRPSKEVAGQAKQVPWAGKFNMIFF